MKKIYNLAIAFLMLTLVSCNDTQDGPEKPEYPVRGKLWQPTERTKPLNNSVLISVILGFGLLVVLAKKLNTHCENKGWIVSK